MRAFSPDPDVPPASHDDRVDPITELVTRTSRTFALGIRRLPPTLRRTVSVAYLTLRVADYFEDNEGMAPSEKVRFLRAWAETLKGARSGAPSAAPTFRPPPLYDDRTPDAHAARAAEQILEAFRRLPPEPREVVGRHVVDSTRGMARWVQTGPAFETEADLDDYMFEVAGRVGLLLTELFALHSPIIAERREEMRRLGVEFGLGLQTVNVIRGLNADRRRGWIFVPSELLPDGVEAEALWHDPGSAQSLTVLDRLVVKGVRHLEAARDYVLLVPRRERGIRIFCLLPLHFALRTLALSRSNPRVFTSEVKLGRDDVASIARRVRLLSASNAWVRSSVRGLLR